ncbi:hypothetical protein GWI33_018763 [Rhynchophorus ferrugineus]|uniref:Uncharacterized protein n=1 Tax=Rhynchophorus ferrugineus TaxID=354439 RepID=A0A834M5Z1_RHYFE|nr:hypothetical protein GWI33_018763 [Rhynchophorus ferrugineus]
MECRAIPLASNQYQIKPRDVDRKVLRETLYSEIIQRHRRSIFAMGSFLRMLKNKKSNYNVVKHGDEVETREE